MQYNLPNKDWRVFYDFVSPALLTDVDESGLITSQNIPIRTTYDAWNIDPQDKNTITFLRDVVQWYSWSNLGQLVSFQTGLVRDLKHFQITKNLGLYGNGVSYFRPFWQVPENYEGICSDEVISQIKTCLSNFKFVRKDGYIWISLGGLKGGVEKSSDVQKKLTKQREQAESISKIFEGTRASKTQPQVDESSKMVSPSLMMI